MAQRAAAQQTPAILTIPLPAYQLALPAPAVIPVLPALHTLHKIDVAIEIP